MQLLKQREKRGTKEWLDKLPQMVKQLEVSLYRSAPSFKAYSDKTTLKQRLQTLAMEIAEKTKDPHTEDSGSSSGGGKGGVGVGVGAGSVDMKMDPSQSQSHHWRKDTECS